MAATAKKIMKRVRALGEEYAMAGDRSTATKYVKSHHKQPPGAHGKRRLFAKSTGYGQQLKEKQKARTFYNLTEKQLKKYYTLGKRQSLSTDIALLVGLERRIDNIIYRAGFTDSHREARQLVSHAQFHLNNKKVDIPSIQVKAGDVITFVSKSKALAEKLKELARGNKPASWLKVKPDVLMVEVVSLPGRAEIEVPFDEKLIIEFYSR